MQATAVVILMAAFALSGVMAAVHNTQCYNYFMYNDGCVQATGNKYDRCPARKPSHHPKSARLMTIQQGSRLERRYDGPARVITQARLVWSCPKIKPDPTGRRPEVCVWAGDAFGRSKTGWLDVTNQNNCGKQVYIQRQRQPGQAKYAIITGGCDFGNSDASVGCFQIAMNQPLFELFNPTAPERASQEIAEVSWDFNNLKFDKPENAAF